MSDMAKVLIVDDDAVFCDLLKRVLTHEGHSVHNSCKADEALAIGASFKPDVLIADWLLQDDLGGLDVALALQKQRPGLRVMFMTGLPIQVINQSIAGLDVLRVYEKPLDVGVVVDDLKAHFSSAAHPPPDAER